MGKVDYAYHLSPGAGWMFNSAQMYEIAGLASSTTDNRPLWQPSMVAGVPDKLEGFPYWVNNDLTGPTTYAAHSRHILFGDFKHYKIRYVGAPMLVRLNELYAATMQTGFIAVQRLDACLIKPNTTTYNPVKYLRKLNT
jgi:HK97 family phage major capsid protein